MVAELLFQKVNLGDKTTRFAWLTLARLFEFDDVGDLHGFVQFGVCCHGKVLYL